VTDTLDEAFELVPPAEMPPTPAPRAKHRPASLRVLAA